MLWDQGDPSDHGGTFQQPTPSGGAPTPASSLTAAECLRAVTGDADQFSKLRSYVYKSLRKGDPVATPGDIDDAIQEACTKLCKKTDEGTDTARFASPFGTGCGWPFAAYFTRTAFNCLVDWLRKEQRRRAKEQNAEEHSRREEEARRSFELSDEFRTKLDLIAADGRNSTDHLQWNAVLERIDPRWNLVSAPFQPWSDVQRAINDVTHRSHRLRGRRLLEFQVLPKHSLSAEEDNSVRKVFFLKRKDDNRDSTGNP